MTVQNSVVTTVQQIRALTTAEATMTPEQLRVRELGRQRVEVLVASGAFSLAARHR